MGVGGKERHGEASSTVVAETSCHHSRTSTFNRVLCPSHPLPDTLVLSTDIHQNLSLGRCRPTLPPPPCWKSTLCWCFYLFFGVFLSNNESVGSAIFLGVQINLRLSNMSSMGLFDEGVEQ